jgi:putative copper export protein
MDATYWLLLASRVLHILGAVVLVGGIFYLRMVVVSRVRSSDSGSDTDVWYSSRRAKWAMWVGIATLVLIVTGLVNFVYIVKTNQSFAAPYHAVFGVKFLLALGVFFLAAILAGKSAAGERFRKNFRYWLGVCLVLGVVVIALGGVLRSMPHVPRATLDKAPMLIGPANTN